MKVRSGSVPFAGTTQGRPYKIRHICCNRCKRSCPFEFAFVIFTPVHVTSPQIVFEAEKEGERQKVSQGLAETLPLFKSASPFHLF
jgi:hypothetical protein